LQAAENEARAKDEIRDQYAASERRAMVLAGEIEELRTQLEAGERARKAAEGELHEASDRVNELSAANSSIAAQKRKLENDLQAIHVLITAFLSFDEDLKCRVSVDVEYSLQNLRDQNSLHYLYSIFVMDDQYFRFEQSSHN
jgi:chromosome segregation ATPase